MPLKGIVDVGGLPRHIGAPRAKSAVPVDGPDPLTQKLALRLLFLIVLSFHFQYEHFALRESDQVVRAELANDAPE